MTARWIAAAALAAIRLLVRLQPRAFRHRFGREILDDTRDDILAAVPSGPRAALVTSARALTDAGRGLLAERARQLSALARKDLFMFRGITTDLSQDLRFAARSLARQPRFAATAVLVLALAIGAATAIFSIVNAVLLRPLPYAEPERLVAITTLLKAEGRTTTAPVIALSDLAGWRPRAGRIVSMGAFAYTQLPVRVGQAPFSPVTALVDAAFLPTLGRPPALGSFFDAASEVSREQSAILSHAFWQTAFGADPAVVGRTFLVDGQPYEVRGVLAHDFQFPRSDASYSTRPIELIVLSSSFPGFPPGSRQWFGVARLAPGVPLREAEAELQAAAEAELQAAAEASNPPRNGEVSSVRLTPLHTETTEASRRPVLTVFAISIVLMLIASTNLMNLLVSRGVGRLRELSIRRALGSTTGRLIRLLLAESLLLASAGCVAGVFLARLTIGLLVAASPVHLPVTDGISIDGTVVFFALGACVLTALAVGALPALHVSLSADAARRHAGVRVSAGGGVIRVQQALCVAQIALGVALVAAAALLAHSLLRLNAVDPGFDTDRVIGFDMSVPSDISLEKRLAFYASAIEEVRTIPGVESAALITFLPPERRAGVIMNVAVEGGVAPDRSTPRANTLVASADYFSTLGMPLVRGRSFSSADDASGEAVAIVNETLARQVFGTTDVIGRRIGTGFDGLKPIRQIVGVARDARDRGQARAPFPTVYLPFTQRTLPYTSMAVRVNTAPEPVTAAIRDRINRLNPNVPLTQFQSVRSRMEESVREPRFYTLMAVVCASMAVLFVMLGLYGLISYSVSRRRPELGIRLALGARPGSILQLVLGQALRIALAGIVLGVLLSVASSKVLSALLFEVQPNDPLTLALAVLLVLAVTLLATYGPARRAAAVDPLGVLRGD